MIAIIKKGSATQIAFWPKARSPGQSYRSSQRACGEQSKPFSKSRHLTIVRADPSSAASGKQLLLFSHRCGKSRRMNNSLLNGKSSVLLWRASLSLHGSGSTGPWGEGRRKSGWVCEDQKRQWRFPPQDAILSNLWFIESNGPCFSLVLPTKKTTFVSKTLQYRS